VSAARFADALHGVVDGDFRLAIEEAEPASHDQRDPLVDVERDELR
jgi:hypothetical protein